MRYRNEIVWFLWRATRLLVPCALLLVLAAVGSPGMVQAQPASVSIVDFAFNPSAITVAAGTTLTWQNTGRATHTTTSTTGAWNSGRLSPGQTFSFTFTQAGTFPYRCDIHQSMQGTVTVSAPMAPAPTPPPAPVPPPPAPPPPAPSTAPSTSTTPKTFRAAGADASAIQAAVDQFRADLGGDNNGVGGTFPTGRREINWDGVPDAVAAPNPLPADFFNTTSARGVIFSTPGSGFQVSANDGVAPVRFGTINPAYEALFSTFSAQRLFTALDSTVTEVSFFVPGTDMPATVSGFGAVFTNVQHNDTTLEAFDRNGISVGLVTVPTGPAAGLAFAGIIAPDGTRIARVKITSGGAALGPDVNDDGAINLVVMDDFIYGEPQADAPPPPPPPAPPPAPPTPAPPPPYRY
jgi:plastocyanin